MNLDKKVIENFADEWINSWNSHEIESIISHYADKLIYISPLIVTRLNRISGTIQTRDELKKYFSMGLTAHPNLYFELICVLYSVKGFTIYYKSARGGTTAEYFELDDQRKVVYVINSYS